MILQEYDNIYKFFDNNWKMLFHKAINIRLQQSKNLLLQL